MEITDSRNKYILTKNIYFADDGYMYFTKKEAEENSLDPKNIIKLGKQTTYVVDLEDLDDELKEEVLFAISEGIFDRDDFYIILNKEKNRVLLMLDKDTMIQDINDKVLVAD